MARWLTEAAAEHKQAGSAEKGFWDHRGVKVLAPAMWAAVLDGKGIGQVVRWLDDLGAPPEEDGGFNETTRTILGILGRHDEEDALLTFKAVLYEDGRQQSGTISTAQTVLDVFADEHVGEACSRSDIDPDTLLDGANTLYLFAPLHEQERLRPIFEALLMSVVRTAMERSAMSGQPLDPAFLVLLDEAGNIAPLRQLAQIASTGAGQGIQLVSVFQDFAQVKHRYGRLAETVVNNHRAKVLLSGLSDPSSLEYMSRLIGEAAETEESRTTGDGRSSTTERTAYRRLAPLSALRQVKPGQGVLIYGHLAPTRLKLRWWKRDRKLRRLAAGGPGGGPGGETWDGAGRRAGAPRGARVLDLDDARSRRGVA
jgi:type IV secretion system protein VirD4